MSALVNQSLSTGIFPEKLKIAKIIPLYKKNEDDDMNNYRPVSLLPIFSKIFEKVVQNQLYNYANNNNFAGTVPANNFFLLESVISDIPNIEKLTFINKTF